MSSGCGDVLSLEDLKTAKKHQLFEAEVITGLTGGVAGGASIDYATNQVTGQIQKTLPAVLRDSGFRAASFTFATGGTLGVNDADLAVMWPGPSGNGLYYSWHGALPKTIPAASSPSSTGGESNTAWKLVGDLGLRMDLAAPGGVLLVNDAAALSGAAFTGDVSALSLKTTALYGRLVSGGKPFGSAGNDWPNSSALRDAITVSRDISANLTDCHGIADKTVITNPTDYGGYGAFDATTWLKGATVQNHIFSFQDRIIHESTANLENQTGFYSRPEIRNTGNVLSRIAVKVYDVQKSSTGAAVENIGFYAENLTGTNVSAITLLQSAGYSIYAPNAGMVQIGGVAGFGTSPVGGTNPVYFKNTAGSKIASVKTTNTDVAFGTQTDDIAGVMVGNALRVQVKRASDSYALTPTTNGTAPLGDASNRWSTVYATSGTINTSNELMKTELLLIDNAERAAALEIKDNIRKFKLLDSVAAKGFSEARWHFGVGAQTVGEIMRKHGLKPENYGFWCYDIWPDQYEEVDGEQLLVKSAGETYGVRYDELAMFIIAAM
ncbi:MAG: hypothetical protein ACRCZO_16095 [Cetobacterium sp.]